MALNVTLLVLAAIVAAWLQATDAPPHGASRLTGRVAYVVDGDTIDLAGHRVRLAGIDAPERGQDCATRDGGRWPCGEAARQALRKLLRDADLACTPRDTDRYGRLVATCIGAGDDPGRQMVAMGLAIASGAYAASEAGARDARLGLWQGEFQRPADWRRDHQPQTTAPNRLQRLIDWLLSLFDS